MSQNFLSSISSQRRKRHILKAIKNDDVEHGHVSQFLCIASSADTVIISELYCFLLFSELKLFKELLLSLRFLLFMKVLVPKPIWTQAVVNRKILAAVLVDIGFRKLRTRAPFVKCQAKSNPRFYQKDNNENLSSKNCQCCPMLGNTSHKKKLFFRTLPEWGEGLARFFLPLSHNLLFGQ